MSAINPGCSSKTIILSILSSIPFFSFAQTSLDTVYFDEDWSICEQPVAEYYRVCTLNKQTSLFYKGSVNDYFSDGTLFMTGQYDNKGLKQGQFLFYNNGRITKRGNFADNKMTGIWEYYNPAGNLTAQFSCKSTDDITPILLINVSGDTLLKNGNGHFIFHTQKDLPGVFPPACSYLMEGAVKNGQKDGTITYTADVGPKYTNTETYKDGQFKKGRSSSYVMGDMNASKPFAFLNLVDEHLDRIDNFYHGNPVFGYDETGDEKVIGLLVNKIYPEVQSDAKSFKDNLKEIYSVIGFVLRHDLKIPESQNVSYQYPLMTDAGVLLSFNLPIQSSSKSRMLNGEITLTIDTLGYLSNSIIKGSLTMKEVEKINYYFSRLSNLYCYQQYDHKADTTVTIKLKTLTNTVQDNVWYKYLIYNGELNEASAWENVNMSLAKPQIQATFPGGQASWISYLQRNLNSDVPVRNNAPAGNYIVIVSFLVDAEGNVSEVNAENDPGYGTAAEAVRVIRKGPKWEAAVNEGKHVSYRQKQSITFQVANR